MRISTGFTMLIHYKIRMIDIYITGRAHILGENEIMLTNLHISYITLNKKHNSMAYSW